MFSIKNLFNSNNISHINIHKKIAVNKLISVLEYVDFTEAIILTDGMEYKQYEKVFKHYSINKNNINHENNYIKWFIINQEQINILTYFQEPITLYIFISHDDEVKQKFLLKNNLPWHQIKKYFKNNQIDIIIDYDNYESSTYIDLNSQLYDKEQIKKLLSLKQ